MDKTVSGKGRCMQSRWHNTTARVAYTYTHRVDRIAMCESAQHANEMQLAENKITNVRIYVGENRIAWVYFFFYLFLSPWK